MRLTLGDLLDQPDFRLRLCAGGDRARAAPIVGAHSTDVRDPVRWLQPRWLMLTTGVQLRGSAPAQRELIARLADARIAALGFGVGVALRRVPRALLDEAQRRSFPVVEVPFETPFREIVSFVDRSALSGDLFLLRRLDAMQRYLLDALHEEAPEQALVDRLAALLGGVEVSYLDAAGGCVATTGSERDWPGFAPRDGAPVPREIDHRGMRGLAAPVLHGDRPIGSLVVLPAAITVPREVAWPVVRAASQLLGLVSVTRASGAGDRRARRRRLGERVVRVLAGEPDTGLDSALATHGIDFTHACRVAVVAGTDAACPLSERRQALDAALEAGGLEFVIGESDGQLVVLAQDELAGLAGALDGTPALAQVGAGVSEPVRRCAEIAAAVAEARLALAAALTAGARPRVQRHETLAPAFALIGGPGGEHARRKLLDVLEPLAAEPRLYAAVIAYLDAELDVGRAAHALGLHRNSLRYRLTRAERVLGRRVRSPETIATLHLALVAQRIARSSSGPERPRDTKQRRGGTKRDGGDPRARSRARRRRVA